MRTRILLLLAAALLVPACKRIPPTPTPGPAISGTAAKGAPIAGALVTLRDAAGNLRTATTSATGDYTIDVGGLTAPFLVKVDIGGGNSYFGIALAAPATSSLTPYSNLIVSTLYGSQGLSAATVFNAPAPLTAPASGALALIESLVESSIRLWLLGEGLDPAAFSFLSTPFETNGQGADAVLDESTITPAAGGFTLAVTDGTTSQATTLTVSGSGSVSADSLTTSPSGSTQSHFSTLIPEGGSPLQTALDGVEAMLAAMRMTVNTELSDLAASELEPYYTADFLSDGKDRAWETGSLATERGFIFGPFTIDGVEAFDDVAGTLAAHFTLPVTVGTGTEINHGVGYFKLDAGAWKFYGNQRSVRANAQALMVRNSTSASTTNQKSITLEVTARVGTLASVTISDATSAIFNNAPVPLQAGTQLEEYVATPGGLPVQIQLNSYFLSSAPLASFPPPGTPLTVTITPTSGPVEVYTILTEGTTTEQFNLLAPVSHSLLAANLGGALTVSWQNVTSFTVVEMDLVCQLYTANFREFFDPDVQSVPGDTTATFHLPTTLNGEPVTMVMVGVAQVGANGERTRVLWWMP